MVCFRNGHLTTTLWHRPCLYYRDQQAGQQHYWRGQWGPDTRQAKLQSTLSLGSTLGCTDKGKCTFIAQDDSGALQPKLVQEHFWRRLIIWNFYLEFLLQQEGFVWLLKAFETTCRQPALQWNLNTRGQCQHKALKWRLPKMKFCTFTRLYSLASEALYS